MLIRLAVLAIGIYAAYFVPNYIHDEKLKKLDVSFDMPKGALYLWAKIPDSAKDSESYVMDMLKEKQVLFAPGSAFGKNGERYVRVSICVDVSTIDSYL